MRKEAEHYAMVLRDPWHHTDEEFLAALWYRETRFLDLAVSLRLAGAGPVVDFDPSITLEELERTLEAVEQDAIEAGDLSLSMRRLLEDAGRDMVNKELLVAFRQTTVLREKIFLGALLLSEKQAAAVVEYMREMIEGGKQT